ncbi:MAG: hypothetical protein NZT92_08170 [Abditibacteriales bacterium]|nr:hypothetical protein [Abditibacteriales bacterium]MDW8365962.1 hypothetical protein [Abditibacteriales bacterium]
MIQYIPSDKGEEEADSRYAPVDAHREPLAHRRWTRREIGVSRGTMAVAFSVVCLLLAVIAPLWIFLSYISQPSEPGAIDKSPMIIPPWMTWVTRIMPWVCMVATGMGLYACTDDEEGQRIAGLVGAAVGSVAFLAWVVVRALSKSFVAISP